MAFTKVTQAEEAEVLSTVEQARIEAGLRRLGKIRLADCTEQEKHQIYWNHDAE